MFITLSEKAFEQRGVAHNAGEPPVPVDHFYLIAAPTRCPLALAGSGRIGHLDLIWGGFIDFGDAQPFCVYSGSGPVLGMANGRVGWFLPQSEKLPFSEEITKCH